ncbi:hypothetical protein AAC387_Pa02g0837 [Persea americana]
MITPFVPSPAPGSDRVSRSNPGAWLILEADGISASTWKPWARLECWRERGPIDDALGYKLELMTDAGSNNILPITESAISARKGGQFCIDRSMVGDFVPGSWPWGRGFVMSSTVEVSAPSASRVCKWVCSIRLMQPSSSHSRLPSTSAWMPAGYSRKSRGRNFAMISKITSYEMVSNSSKLLSVNPQPYIDDHIS